MEKGRAPEQDDINIRDSRVTFRTTVGPEFPSKAARPRVPVCLDLLPLAAPSATANKLFLEEYFQFFVAEVAQTFGHSLQTAESLGDFRYKMLNSVAPQTQRSEVRITKSF